MQVKCWWHSTGRVIVYFINRRFWKSWWTHFWHTWSEYQGLLESSKNIMPISGPFWRSRQICKTKMFCNVGFFGLNSLFITTTPDDECSFRVRLYTKPQNWVSVQNLSKILRPWLFYQPFYMYKNVSIDVLIHCIYCFLFSLSMIYHL